MADSDVDQRYQQVENQTNLVVNINEDDGQWESLLVIEQFSIPSTDTEKIQAVFEKPKGYTSAKDIFNQKKLLWIVGQSGIGKRTLALSLSTEESERTTYIIPRFVNWSQVDASEIENANLIFTDTLGAVGFERKNLESELIFLESLIKRGNKIIITTPDDVYFEALKALPRFIEWVNKSTKPFTLDNDAYSYTNKINIFKKTLSYAHDEAGIISDEQKKWGLDLIETSDKSDGQQIGVGRTKNRALFQKLIKEVWLPIDIDRFVETSLASAVNPSGILELLHRDANIDNRIHSWFMGLDDSTRCFILTLSLFVGSETEELWSKYKEIVSALRKLDPNLSIFPLGILRQRATPYVTENGTVDFVNPRVYKAVVNEVSKNYREYFVELIPLLKKWSIPDLPSTITKEERENRLDDTEDTRNTIARMVGEFGKYGVNDIDEILESWATNPFGTIGKTAGIALRETVTDPANAQEALNLIHKWAVDFSSQTARFHRWTAGSVLWRIASIKSRFDLTNFSLRHLQKLAEDPDPYVVSSAAHAFRMMGPTVPIQDMARPLSKLANEDEVFTRQQIAYAVDEVASQNREGAYQLLKDWLASGQENVIWTATYVLLTSRNISRQERYPKLETILISFTLNFTNALYHAFLDEENIEIVYSVIETLADEKPDILIQKLADMKQENAAQFDELQALIINVDKTSIKNISLAIDSEIYKRNEEERLERERIEKEKAQIEQAERIRLEREQNEINQLEKMISRRNQQRSLFVKIVFVVTVIAIVFLLAGWINNTLNSSRNSPAPINSTPTPITYISSPTTEATTPIRESTNSVISYTATAISITCNGFTSLLQPGITARVTSVVGVNMRKNAGTGYEITGTLSTYDKVKILMDAPLCNEGYLWWKVESINTGISGWVVEGTAKERWVSP